MDLSTLETLSAAQFRALARGRLSQTFSTPASGTLCPSDYDLNPTATKLATRQLTEAAVLIGIVARSPLSVLLTRRSPDLKRHAGQIAFPGGRVDPEDGGPTTAALREAHEEIGLEPSFVEPLGFLDAYRTGTGYLIAPLVALVEPGFTLKLQTSEVADVFEVPLAFLMNTNNHEIHDRVLEGAARRFHAVSYESHYIWGATAGILKNMQTRLFLP